MTTTQLRRVTGYVWCDVHCSIHDDTSDPFEDGTACDEHRPVYVRAKPEEGEF